MDRQTEGVGGEGDKGGRGGDDGREREKNVLL